MRYEHATFGNTTARDAAGSAYRFYLASATTSDGLGAGAAEPLAKRSAPRPTAASDNRSLYRSGLLMSQRPNGLNPPGVTGEPFEKGWLFPVGPKRLGERILQQGDRLECPV